MIKKKKIIIISIITVFLILMGVLAGLYVNSKSNKNNKENFKVTTSQKAISKNKATLTDVEKEIIGIETSNSENEEDKEETYSDLYKEYLELPEEEKEKIEIIPRKQEVPFEKLEEIKETLKEDSKDEQEEEKTPERFNLAEKIDIKVENQGPYGLCWDFASIKTLETYLALNNLGDYDFSELHVDYITSDLMYGYRKLHAGGNFRDFKDYVIESGVVLEEKVPFSYQDYSEEEYNKFSDIEKIVRVTETVDFPSLYKNESSTFTEEQIEEFRENVKKHIMKNGGLYCVIATPDFGTKYLNTSTNAECFIGNWKDLPKGREIHAVTIVGWDDNYSKENFNAEMRPKNDGAYIILNSWGTFFGNEGYYYVSYEDQYIETQLSGIISTSMDSAYKINSIKNSVLKDYLKNRYGHIFVNYNGEDYITKNALSNIDTLDLSNSNLFSLEGIEIFANLYNVNLSNNNIKDITPLAKLTCLSSIDLSNNNISDISPLSNMKKKSLYSINLANNKIKDVKPLNDIVNENEWAILDLDISNNPNVKGYEKLNNVWSLNISDCNIKDVSNLKDCEKLLILKIANTPGIEGLDELPKNLYELDISNCNIDKLPKLHNKIGFLNISNNNITTLDGIQDFEKLNILDVSGNSITDWSALKEINRVNLYQNERNTEDKINEQTYETNEQTYETNEQTYETNEQTYETNEQTHETNEQTYETNEQTDENEEYYKDYLIEMSIIANNCNIEDITIFNDLSILRNLHLKDNKIKDVSQFKNEKIYYIDLSNNENLTGLQGLSTVPTLFLNNCNINDISEVLKLEDVNDLSIENNDLTDITDISKLKYLLNISLAGNKNLRGTITSDSIYNLNVSDCNLDNSFDFSKISNLSYLNISKNTGISDVSKIIENIKTKDMILFVDELDFEELEKIKKANDNKYFYIDSVVLTLNYNLADNKIDLSQNKLLKRELMKNFVSGDFNIKNGHLSKNGYIINIDNTSQDSVEIKFETWNSSFLGSTIKIIFNPNAIKPKETNITNNNTITNNTTNENTNTQNILNNNININFQNSFNNNVNIVNRDARY